MDQKRKLKGKTDYRKRLMLLKSRKTRLVIRRANKNILLQIVNYEDNGDKVTYSAKSNELKKFGWNGSVRNIPCAYLTGILLAKKVKEKNKELVADIGMQTNHKGSVIYAALKGAIDGGLNVAHAKDIFPDEKRLMGEHIINNNKTKYSKIDNKEFSKLFNKIKESVMAVEWKKKKL